MIPENLRNEFDKMGLATVVVELEHMDKQLGARTTRESAMAEYILEKNFQAQANRDWHARYAAYGSLFVAILAFFLALAAYYRQS
jgi:hypothetical protein